MIDGVVLDVKLGDAQLLRQSVGADQRGRADVAADGRLAVDREEFAVAPHGAGPGRDRLAGERPGDSLVVVGHFQRPEVLGAEIESFLGVELAAKATLQTRDQFT